VEKNLTMLVTIDTGPLDDPITATIVRRYMSLIRRPLEEVLEKVVFYTCTLTKRRRCVGLKKLKQETCL